MRERLVVHRVVGGRVSTDRYLAHHEQLERAFTLTLLETKPDVVHVVHLYGLAPQLIAIAKRLRVPVLVTMLDHYYECPLFHLEKTTGALCRGANGGRECETTCFSYERRPERWRLRYAYFRDLLAVADRVHCPSEHVARRFEALVPEVAPVVTTPIGVAVEGTAAARVRTGEDPLALGYLGSVVPHKGVDVVVDAAVAARVPVALEIFGPVYDEGYGRALERRASASADVRLTLHGPYDNADVPRLLSGVDAVVVPSKVPEVYPAVPYEALARGVPVLAGSLGGLPESVDDGVNGLVFDSYRTEELAALLRRLAADPALLARLREGASATHVVQVPEHVDAMRALYDDVARSDPTVDARIDALERSHRELVAAGFARAY